MVGVRLRVSGAQANLDTTKHSDRSENSDYLNVSAISLFSGAAIGDKGLERAGLCFLLFNEIDEKRAALIRANFPESKVIDQDVQNVEQQICNLTSEALAGRELFALIATPPCQGMSPNGLGKLLNNARRGLRPELDPRNRLILPALRIAKAIQPKWVILENVPRMEYTVIEDERKRLVRILDLIPDYLGEDYVGEAKTVEFADYGVPQRRQRLITIYSRLPEARGAFEAGRSLIPVPTHDKLGRHGLSRWVTVRDAIGHFPPLDARNSHTARDPDIPFHHVSVLDPKKYEWIRHTPKNGSTFDNQCVNPECRFDGNPTHGSKRDSRGINRARRDTPLYCMKCGHLLPRPYTVAKDGSIRLMRGYTSAYKRMSWDLPAPTLTQNLSYACSDHKLHPSQNRVLSLAEACKLQTISDFEYRWGPLAVNGRGPLGRAPDTLIRDAIGESVPPRFTYLLGRHILSISLGDFGDPPWAHGNFELIGPTFSSPAPPG